MLRQLSLLSICLKNHDDLDDDDDDDFDDDYLDDDVY
jgi:hypothetical protein